jgi:aerobic-type carbon monoxide dehydrogenase small subunit (CoxS/CutS family)
MTEAIEVAVTINGRAHRLSVAPRRVLADVLREDLQLLGCKIGTTRRCAALARCSSMKCR